MKKFFALFLSLALLLSVFSGCTNQATTEDSTESIAVNESTESNVIVDELGREVEIPKDPEKVLGLTSAVMEALFNVGITPIGKVEEYKIREEGINLPSVGMTNTLNMEKIYELEPDFIIASSRYHSAMKNELELAGCPIYFFDPDAIGEISIVDLTPFIGDLLGKKNAGDDYKAKIMAQSDDLTTKIDQIGGYKNGMIIKTGDTLTCAQKSSGYGALLILLGIDNIVPDDLPNANKSPYVAYDVEQIIKDNPDVIFVIAPGKDAENNKAILNDIKSDEKWTELTAIKNDKIFMLPFSVNPNRMNVEDMLNTTANLIINKK
jgi:iron complex transport system substrate-binding protein